MFYLCSMNGEVNSCVDYVVIELRYLQEDLKDWYLEKIITALGSDRIKVIDENKGEELPERKCQTEIDALIHIRKYGGLVKMDDNITLAPLSQGFDAPILHSVETVSIL